MGGCISSDDRTDRGGAKLQDKTWVKVVTGQVIRFIHCGNFPKNATGLLLKYSKEIINVSADVNAPKKFMLAYPTGDDDLVNPPPDHTQLGKPIQLLWSYDECPNAVIFDIPIGTVCYVETSIGEDGKPEALSFKPNSQVAFPQDIVFADCPHVWHYTRAGSGRAINKDTKDYPTFS